MELESIHLGDTDRPFQAKNPFQAKTWHRTKRMMSTAPKFKYKLGNLGSQPSFIMTWNTEECTLGRLDEKRQGTEIVGLLHSPATSTLNIAQLPSLVSQSRTQKGTHTALALMSLSV